MDKKYNSNNLDKALNRMENADTLKEISRKSTNIMSFFDENDKEYELQKQQSAAELKKKKYLKKVELLKELLQKKGTKNEINFIIAFGSLLESSDFFNLPLEKKQSIKSSMVNCNKIYKKYLDS